MSWTVSARAEPVVTVRAPPRVSVRASGHGITVTVPKQGPPGPPGQDGDGAGDPGDLTLIFENHLI